MVRHALRVVGIAIAMVALPACSSIMERDAGLDANSAETSAPSDASDAHDATAPRDGMDVTNALDSSTDIAVDASSADSTVADTGPPDSGDPCAARPCRYDQRCVPNATGYDCVDPCAGVACAAPAMCFAFDVNGQPLAPDAYGSPTGVCIDPCANVMCASNQSCVPSAHGVPLGACVDRCDCRNCGNCGFDGTFVGEQAFCGNPDGGMATMACTTPCTGGAGCIPWDSQGGICWPLEGCFSQ